MYICAMVRAWMWSFNNYIIIGESLCVGHDNSPFSRWYDHPQIPKFNFWPWHLWAHIWFWIVSAKIQFWGIPFHSNFRIDPYNRSTWEFLYQFHPTASQDKLERERSNHVPHQISWLNLPIHEISCPFISHIIIYWLVVSTPLKNMKVSWDDYSQYMVK